MLYWSSPLLLLLLLISLIVLGQLVLVVVVVLVETLVLVKKIIFSYFFFFFFLLLSAAVSRYKLSSIGDRICAQSVTFSLSHSLFCLDLHSKCMRLITFASLFPLASFTLTLTFFVFCREFPCSIMCTCCYSSSSSSGRITYGIDIEPPLFSFTTAVTKN